jgi:pyruvate formate lyase activating enzyme
MPPAGTSTAKDRTDTPAARWWQAQPDGRILCTLCPRYCRMADGQAGFCYIRQNRGGRLVQLGYGRSTGFAIDPIEKKPLNHFFPGTPVLSFGTAGCNLGCKFCQNWDISKAKLDEEGLRRNTPGEVVDLAIAQGSPSIAYTYNDPVIWAEYVIDIARAARQRGIKNVLVTAGYVTDEARPELYADADAANVDLKAFTEDFYRKTTASHLEAVLETLKWIRHKSTTWLEVTTLLIPGHNDGDDELRRLSEWFAANLGPDVPCTSRPSTPTSR